MSDFHKIVIPRTAHFYTLGTASSQVKNLWIVCHGIGQTADDFITNFEKITDDENFIVAPEGLNKFYWGGFDGAAVATWMTRRHRLDEIADYSHFINSIFHHYKNLCSENVKVILLGFSQGCATQVRYIMEKHPDFHALVLCGGGMPEDIDYHTQPDYWNDKPIFFLCGDKDRFITPALIAQHDNLLAQKGLSITEKIIFDGKHELKPEPLLKVKEILNDILVNLV